eukprot:PhM_4_TR9236/c1_g1_i1/m.72569
MIPGSTPPEYGCSPPTGNGNNNRDGGVTTPTTDVVHWPQFLRPPSSPPAADGSGGGGGGGAPSSSSSALGFPPAFCLGRNLSTPADVASKAPLLFTSYHAPKPIKTDYSVVEARRRDTGDTHVIKCVSAEEAQAHRTLHPHPNIVPHITITREIRDTFVVMPLLGPVPLEEIQASPIEQRRLALDVLRGLAHIHATGHVHGDVRPQNILYRGGRHRQQLLMSDEDETGAVSASYCLCDFGATRRVGAPRASRFDKTFCDDLGGDDAALESSDAFAAGLTLFSMITGTSLPKVGEAWREVRAEGAAARRHQMCLDVGVDALVADVLCGLTDNNRSMRLTVAGALGVLDGGAQIND